MIGDDDEQVEAWYLLAFVLHKISKFSTSLECANNVVTLATKLKISNPELQAGTEEIIKDCKKQQEKLASAKYEVIEGKDGDDSGFETMSEENIGSEGDNDEDQEMKE